MVEFWHDLGCEEPLKFSYPELFSIAHCNDAWGGGSYEAQEWK
jgi:hypothetical protein